MPTCRSISVVVFLTLCPPLMAQTPTEPPMARQVEHISTWHGEKINDPFFWLREKSNPEVIKYLEAENAYTESMTKEHPALRRRALSRDARPHQADGPHRAGHAAAASATTRAPRKASSTPSTAARSRRARRLRQRKRPGRGSARPERAGQGPQVPLAWCISRERRRPTGSPTRSTPRAFASTGSTSRTCAPARSFPTAPSASPRSSGAPTTTRSSTRPKTPSPNAQTWSGAIASATRPSPSTRKRTGSSRSAWAAARTRRCCSCTCRSTDTWEVRYLPSRLGRQGAFESCCRAKRATNTASSTGTASSTFARTKMPRTSAW